MVMARGVGARGCGAARQQIRSSSTRATAREGRKLLSKLEMYDYDESDDEDDYKTFSESDYEKMEKQVRRSVPAFPCGRRWRNPFPLKMEEDSRLINEKTMVWWDMDDTPLPSSAYAPSPICDKHALLCRMMIDIGISTGSRKYSSHANHLLISSDIGFITSMEQLKVDGCNFLLARSSTKSCTALESMAFKVWDWEDLVEGGPPLLHQKSKLLPRAARYIGY